MSAGTTSVREDDGTHGERLIATRGNEELSRRRLSMHEDADPITLRSHRDLAHLLDVGQLDDVVKRRPDVREEVVLLDCPHEECPVAKLEDDRVLDLDGTAFGDVAMRRSLLTAERDCRGTGQYWTTVQAQARLTSRGRKYGLDACEVVLHLSHGRDSEHSPRVEALKVEETSELPDVPLEQRVGLVDHDARYLLSLRGGEDSDELGDPVRRDLVEDGELRGVDEDLDRSRDVRQSLRSTHMSVRARGEVQMGQTLRT